VDDVGFSNVIGGAQNMRVLLIGPIEKTGGVSTHTRYMAEKLRDMGVQVEIYNTSPYRDYPKLLEYLIKGYRKSLGVLIFLTRAKRRIDIVHVQASGGIFGFMPALFTIITKKLFKLNFKVLMTFHYSKTEQFVKKWPKFFRYAFKNIDILFLVSEKQFETILKNLNGLHYAKNKIIVIKNGFDSKKFFPIEKTIARKMLGIPKDVKVILTVGNLVKEKGHKYLIHAMKKVVNEKQNLLCFIIGRGPLKEELEKIIKNLGLENNIKLLGFVPDDKINLWMNAADIFVLPSLSEGNPTVMFEALACGKPFVGTRVGGVPEIITSEDYGLLCELANPDDLAEKILIALEKEWDREKIRKYAEQFTWDNIAKKVVEVYEEVLKV